jgi:hypothetical protein
LDEESFWVAAKIDWRDTFGSEVLIEDDDKIVEEGCGVFKDVGCGEDCFLET